MSTYKMSSNRDTKNNVVVHIPASKYLRVLKICNIIDAVPPTKRSRIVVHDVPNGFESVKYGVYDPVIDLDMKMIVYGLSDNEMVPIENQLRKRGEDLSMLFYTPFQITFSIHKLEMLKKYGSVFGALAELMLVIDCGEKFSADKHVVKCSDWFNMDRQQRIELLKNVLGDEERARVALEYLEKPQYTGIHLAKKDEAWGYIAIFNIDKVYPITEEQLEKAYGKRKNVAGWVRAVRLIDIDEIDAIIRSAKVVFSSDMIKKVLCS